MSEQEVAKQVWLLELFERHPYTRYRCEEPGCEVIYEHPRILRVEQHAFDLAQADPPYEDRDAQKGRCPLTPHGANLPRAPVVESFRPEQGHEPARHRAPPVGPVLAPGDDLEPLVVPGADRDDDPPSGRQLLVQRLRHGRCRRGDGDPVEGGAIRHAQRPVPGRQPRWGAPPQNPSIGPSGQRPDASHGTPMHALGCACAAQ